MTTGTAATALVQERPLSTRRSCDPVAWACEAVGTLAMLFVGFSAVGLVNAHSSPLHRYLPSTVLRYALIGVGFGVAVAAVVASPIGRRSGAHLNPAVTLAFWLRHETSDADALGYVTAQCLGATASAGAFSAVWGKWAAEVHGGRTEPAQGIAPLTAAGIELLLTFGLVIAVLVIVGSPRLTPWTPSAIGLVLAILICAGAATTGASFNPARTLGPALVGGDFTALWVYLLGPLAGSALAVAAYSNTAPRRLGVV